MRKVNCGLIPPVSRRLLAFNMVALATCLWGIPAIGDGTPPSKTPAPPDPPTTMATVNSDYTLTTTTLSVPYKVTRDANGITLVPLGKVQLVINGVHDGKPLPDAINVTITGTILGGVPFTLTTEAATKPDGIAFKVDVTDKIKELLKDVSPLLSSSPNPAFSTFSIASGKVTVTPFVVGGKEAQIVAGSPFTMSFHLQLGTPPAAPAP